MPPTDRSPAGYRRYGPAAVARLELVRTLRELGLDLATIRRVVDQEVPLPEVAAAHAEALAVQIRVLRLRQAVLTVAAEARVRPGRGGRAASAGPAHQSRARAAHPDFLGSVFAGLGDQPAYRGVVVSMTPELPDDPDTAQVEAWLELAELCREPEFRARMGGWRDSTPPIMTSRGCPAQMPSRWSGMRWPPP